MINQRRLIGLVVYLNIFMISCAVSTDYSEGGNPIPGSWTLATPVPSNQCASIGGEYQTRGLGRLKASEEFTQARLDAVLGHAFPSNDMPDQVRISVNENVNTLEYQFGHPVNQSFSLSTHCRDGWYVSEKKLKDTYIGEGGTMDYSIRKIEFAKSSNGAVIVHVMLEVQSSLYFAFKARDTREIWSKFEELNSKN